MRRRVERARPHLEAAGHTAEKRQLCRVGAVGLGPRGSTDAVRDLGLDHHHGTPHRWNLGKHLEDEGRRHLVGQVRDKLARLKREPVRNHPEGIPHHQVKPFGVLRAGLGQHRLELAVGLNGADGACVRQHGHREGANARPHLKHNIRGVKLRQVQNPPDHGVIHQEVLPKPVLCRKPKPVEHISRCRLVGKPGVHGAYFF